MLTIAGLDAGYGELQILHEVDIHVKPGEIVALIGPNGAGKSTVLKSVFAIADVRQGRMSFEGKEINGLKTHELLQIGISFVPQGKINFSELTIEENLLLGGREIKDKEELEENLKKVYQRFPALRMKKKELAFSLSGGQQQMLALGRALMQNPKLLLMDEPSLGLSPKLQKELFSMLVELRKDGISILVVEQNAKKAIEIANQTYLLENGRVVLHGGKEILEDKKIKQVYLGGA